MLVLAMIKKRQVATCLLLNRGGPNRQAIKRRLTGRFNLHFLILKPHRSPGVYSVEKDNETQLDLQNFLPLPNHGLHPA